MGVGGRTRVSRPFDFGHQAPRFIWLGEMRFLLKEVLKKFIRGEVFSYLGVVLHKSAFSRVSLSFCVVIKNTRSQLNLLSLYLCLKLQPQNPLLYKL